MKIKLLKKLRADFKVMHSNGKTIIFYEDFTDSYIVEGPNDLIYFFKTRMDLNMSKFKKTREIRENQKNIKLVA